jgi:hypothetical protein
MATEPLINRDEVTAMLFMLADVNANVARIVRLLVEEFDGEEGLDDDA